MTIPDPCLVAAWVSALVFHRLFHAVLFCLISAILQEHVWFVGQESRPQPNCQKYTDAMPFIVSQEQLSTARCSQLWFACRCGHCKKLGPEYEKAAGPLKKNDPPVTLVKIDATVEDNKPLAEKFGVQGFPTLKVHFQIIYDFPLERPVEQQMANPHSH